MTSVSQYLVICITAVILHLVQSRKILLRDLNTLTLRHGEFTTSRRTSPVPQLKCVGGNAGCYAFIPQHVQCYNRGSDGYDIQWECKTDMDDKYRFGKIDVACEGYDYADDHYVLAGSCGLEYTIDSTSTKNSAYNSYSKSDYSDHSTGFGSAFGFICVIMIIFFVYRTCFAGDNANYQNIPNPSAPPPPSYTQATSGSGAFDQHPHGPPPPYGFRPEFQQQQQQPKYYPTGAQQSNDGQPGFFSGMLAGGLLGYLFGNNGNTRPGYDNSHYSHGYQRDWFGSPINSGVRGSSPFSSGSSSSSSSRTASGFGGTKRR